MKPPGALICRLLTLRLPLKRAQYSGIVTVKILLRIFNVYRKTTLRHITYLRVALLFDHIDVFLSRGSCFPVLGRRRVSRTTKRGYLLTDVSSCSSVVCVSALFRLRASIDWSMPFMRTFMPLFTVKLMSNPFSDIITAARSS